MYIKVRLDSHNSEQSLCDQLMGILEEIPKLEFLKTFIKWRERIKLCIKNNGEYFENLY